ncbi:hypothetical protein [Methanobrevibacter sp.]|uniref:DUF7226 domain-containing protein n=1 Tax=Methanobrevibacter sp. TaxID=66852 RepID=UPI0038684A06
MLDEDYIFREGDKFIIKRDIGGRLIHFGSFNTLDDAIKHRDELDFDGWPIPKENPDPSIIEENIQKISEDEYIVFRFIDNEKEVFGPYNSLELAKKAKYNLKFTGWESDLDYVGSKYGRYIYKQHEKFVVRRVISGEFVDFGTFDSLDEAKKARDDLVFNNWGKYNIPRNRGYGKYITKLKDKFKVQRVINGEMISFGYYDTLEDATKARDKFESENWQNIPEQKRKNRYIHKTSRGYVIYKRIGGELKHFGTFRTLEEANKEKEILISNNWQLNKRKLDSTNYGRNIEFDGNYFTIERFVYNELRVYGVFKNKDLALKEKEKLQLNYWKAPYRLKTREYPYGENIVPFDYLFNVEFYQNGELKEFGPFHSFEEAVNKCNEIEADEDLEFGNVFQDKFDFDDDLDDNQKILLEIYNQVELIPEPKIPFPQADVFETFVEICKELNVAKSLTRDEIMDNFQINPRQYSFYISAGEYLGLIERSRSLEKRLSELGLEVFSGDSETINLDLTYLILEHKPFYDVFGLYLKNGKIPTSDEIFEVLRNNEIYNVDSEVTLKRRATSVRSWIKWIVDQF